MSLDQADFEKWKDIPPEWKELRSLASFLAYFRREYGLRKVRQLLVMTVEQVDCHREYLQETADELKVLGLHKVATLVAQAAARCPSKLDMRFCPYMVPPNTDYPDANKANIKMWLWSQQRRLDQQRKRSRELLRKAGVDPDWQDHISK